MRKGYLVEASLRSVVLGVPQWYKRSNKII